MFRTVMLMSVIPGKPFYYTLGTTSHIVVHELIGMTHLKKKKFFGIIQK